MNETIETLYNNLDNKDKIINEQALEIARLNEINENKQKEIDKLVCIIYKAIDYINNNTYFKDNVVKTMIFKDFSNDLLEILGDKE